MADGPKKPVPSEPSITSFAEGHGWHLTPEETQRRMMDHVERIMRAKQEQIEREQRAAEEFERGLQEKLESMEANPPADTAEPAVDVQAPKPKAARQAKSAKSKRAKPTKPGRFAVSDRLHFPAMEKLIVDGMSVEAAAQRLGEHLQGAGTPENKGHRLAKLYRKERGR